MLIPVNLQIFIMHFSTITPSWQCTTQNGTDYNNTRNNSSTTSCTTQTIYINSDYRRCSLPRNEWKYTTENEFSIVTQFGIDCNKEWILHLLTSMVFVGYIIGSIVLGWIADKRGRKYVIFPSFASILVLGFLSSFSSNIIVVIFSRFLIGLFYPGVYIQVIVLVNELIGGKYRAIAGVILLISMPAACCILTLKAYFAQHWRLLSIISTAPYIILLFAYLFIPESPPWLLSRDRTDDVIIIVRRIASWNGRELSKEVVAIQPKSDSEDGTVKLIDVCKGRDNVFKLAKLAILWAAIILGFYGVTLAADDLGGTIYRDFFIISVIEIPVRIISGPVCNHLGRKKGNLIPLLCCSVALFAVAAIPTHMKTARLAIGIIGKLAVTMVAGTVYTWSMELYPVSVRSRMLGVFQVFGRLGGVAAPWVAKGLKQFGAGFGFVVMAAVALVAVCAGTRLPDTRGDHKDGDEHEMKKEEEGKEGEGRELNTKNQGSNVVENA